VSPRLPRSRGANPAEIATRRAVTARDAGLARISVVTRWLIAGVVGLSGALALLAAQAFHGRTVSNGSTATPPPVTQAATPSNTPSGLQPPAQAPVQAPVQTPSAPVVVSGGS
jgi:hypothetical protein